MPDLIFVNSIFLLWTWGRKGQSGLGLISYLALYFRRVFDQRWISCRDIKYVFIPNDKIWISRRCFKFQCPKVTSIFALRRRVVPCTTVHIIGQLIVNVDLCCRWCWPNQLVKSAWRIEWIRSPYLATRCRYRVRLWVWDRKIRFCLSKF